MLLTYATAGLYDRAIIRGWWYNLWAALRGRSSRLLDLRTLSANWRIREHYFLGEQSVPIKQIRGSESRSADFDADFHPTQPHIEERWRTIAQLWLAGVALPPVDLVQVGDVYFVRDGHHRISVAKALGAKEIDAIVTVWQVDGPLPWKQPAKEQRAAVPQPGYMRAAECV